MKDQEKVHEIRLKPCPFCSGRAELEEVLQKMNETEGTTWRD